jgi:uncharacterized membrane protein YcjF (UPF0283 family)
MTSLIRRLGVLLHQRRVDADVRAELEFHREMKQREFEATGIAAADASLAASRTGVVTSGVGIAIGVALARATTTLVQSLVWGVQATDPLTFVVAALIGVSAAIVAIAVPTVRVLQLNPVEALRDT